jgi:hypothetical protein
MNRTTYLGALGKNSKFSSSHSTFHPLAEPLILACKNIPEVTSGSIGAFSPKGGRVRKIKFEPDRLTGKNLVITINGGGQRQELLVYTTDPELVKRKLQEVWERKCL